MTRPAARRAAALTHDTEHDRLRRIARSEPVNERADLYSLGAILYHLLAGHPPYWDSVEHPADRLIAAAVQQPPTPIGTLVPRAPVDLRAIVERAMASDKAARFATAKDMAEELRRFETGQRCARASTGCASWWCAGSASTAPR